MSCNFFKGRFLCVSSEKWSHWSDLFYFSLVCALVLSLAIVAKGSSYVCRRLRKAWLWQRVGLEKRTWIRTALLGKLVMMMIIRKGWWRGWGSCWWSMLTMINNNDALIMGHMGPEHASREKKLPMVNFLIFVQKNVSTIRFQEMKIRPLKGFEKMRFLCFYIIAV